MLSLSDLRQELQIQLDELCLVEMDLSEAWRLKQIAVNLAALSRYVKHQAELHKEED